MSARLILGDCIEKIADICTDSIDLILADPPYGTTLCKWDSVINLQELWPELKRVIKPGGAVIMTAQTPFDKVLGCSNLPWLRYEWIWEKGNATGFFNAKKMPLKAHENILVFYEKLPVYNPIKTHGHERKSAGRKDVNSECYGKAVKKVVYDSTSRYPRSVQKFSSDKQRESFHPTQKPIALMQYLIETYTNQGDVVLDFCMGSGTTGVACELTDRQFIGIEKDKRYFDISLHRIARSSNSRPSKKEEQLRLEV